MNLRGTDGILTLLVYTALENAHIDKAVAARRRKTSSRHEEEDQSQSKRGWSKRHARGSLREAQRQAKASGWPFNLECVAHGQFRKAQVDLKSECNVFEATVQGVFAGQNGSFTENELFPLEACQNRLARRLFATTRRNFGPLAKTGTQFEQRVAAKARNCANRNGAHNSSLGLGQKIGGAILEGRPFSPANAERDFWQARLDKYFCTTDEVKLTIYATPWTQQFRDDVEALMELDEGDELDGDLRKGLLLCVLKDFCTLDLNVVRATCWSRAISSPGTRRELGEVLDKETHKTYHLRQNDYRNAWCRFNRFSN